MNKWDLSTIYPSFESDSFKNDLNSLDNKIQNLEKLELTDNFEQSAVDYINMANDLLATLFPLYTYANLTYAVNSDDNTALMYIDVLGNKVANLTAAEVTFQKWLANYSVSDIDNASSEVIKEHSFYLKEIIENAKYLLSEKEEILLAKMRITASNAWSNLQGQLTGDLQTDFTLDGEKKRMTLSMIRNLANHADADVRKRAYETELSIYTQVESAVAASLNAIKGEVITVAEMRGYESPLEESVKQARIDMDSLNAMIEAMKDKLPAFRKYLKRKGELLGHKNGLPFYDLAAPINNSGKHYTYEEAQAFVLKNFATFSEELKDVAKNIFDSKWVDVEPRKGKRGGAFCAGIKGRKQSRVMLNFDGSFSQVSTIAHEFGHAYHNYVIQDETPINYDYPMTLAETASIFCETIVTNAAAKEATPDEAIYILEKSIEQSTAVIVDILSRFLFEDKLFEARKQGPVSVEQLKEFMLDAQKQTYGDGLDANYLHPYMWACKPHYYSAGFNYYNYPYAFGLLFSTGLYAEYKSGRENFVADYNKLLKSTTRMNAKDAAATMGIDITKKEFWLNSLSIIEEEIETFLELTK